VLVHEEAGKPQGRERRDRGEMEEVGDKCQACQEQRKPIRRQGLTCFVVLLYISMCALLLIINVTLPPLQVRYKCYCMLHVATVMKRPLICRA
jgi:hypothetical protein